MCAERDVPDIVEELVGVFMDHGCFEVDAAAAIAAEMVRKIWAERTGEESVH
jgi:hypothetical protein